MDSPAINNKKLEKHQVSWQLQAVMHIPWSERDILTIRDKSKKTCLQYLFRKDNSINKIIIERIMIYNIDENSMTKKKEFSRYIFIFLEFAKKNNLRGAAVMPSIVPLYNV